MSKILDEPHKGAKPLTLVGLAIVVGGLLFYANYNKGSATSSGGQYINSDQASSIYKDGTYSAEGTYNTPAGTQKINVKITLSSDIITDAIASNDATDRTSSRYEDLFISSYKQYVIGKNINGLNLKTVSGASLTPKGFNSALGKIREQAA